MGPVNLKNPSFSFSVRFTVKNTILDRIFARLLKFQLPDMKINSRFQDNYLILSSFFEAGQFIFSIP
ncbi:hypothetical protein IX84_31610 [Phaeodactylibacter xiamenensis]|uniref:Uncharacterized protein n=1 Tax=Phaeodactylibacter xiamenensis TaxID=1524460 RepID=A0A098RZ83_9BACT|nr:hypothetical protein IX84_31610 [Phaeodactylibacter xiamenensis]